MKAIPQSEIISLIADLNAFADRAENLIHTTQLNYDREKKRLLDRQKNALTALESSYVANCKAVKGKSNETIKEAKRILSDIDGLDQRLSKVDKYFVKTKSKKAELLADATSDAYADETDYFLALDKIREQFRALYKKYAEDILPGLINGLNYLFSSKRRADYEELIILHNTVEAFVREIEEALPPLTEEHLAELKNAFSSNRAALTEKNNREFALSEKSYSDTLDQVAGQIWEELDSIFPDKLVQYFQEIQSGYTGRYGKVNTTGEIQDEVLYMAFLDYPVDILVQSKVVSSVIKEKCNPLVVGDSIRFPIIVSTADAPVWLIEADNTASESVEKLIHSMMFGFLNNCPVSSLRYRVVDPEGRGNSVSPYFGARKTLPDLFGEKFYIERDEVSAVIKDLNNAVEDILQDKLGTQYHNIFEYAKNHKDYLVNVEFLTLFDFPNEFDERTIAELRNILRNGSRCGIYTVIAYAPSKEMTFTNLYQQSLDSVIGLTSVIRQSQTEFLFHGLSFNYPQMPDRGDFSKFFSKYMLVYEGIKHRGIAFSPLLKKLMDAADSGQVSETISEIAEMAVTSEASFGKVPEIDCGYPDYISVGSMRYPADIFSDSIGCQQIQEAFGIHTANGCEHVRLPFLLSLKNNMNFMLYCPETSSQSVLSFTHQLIWGFLSFLPVTKVNVCVFDAEQRGNSLTPFLDFRKQSPETFDQEIYTGQHSISNRLREISAQIDEFVQDKLGNKYSDILEYNRNTPSRAEPITLLVIYDFPSGLEGQSIDLLTNILRNGSRCGVYTLVCYNPEVQYSRYESIDQRIETMQKYCNTVEWKDGKYCLLPYNLEIELPEKMHTSEMEAFAKAYIERAETIKTQGLSFRDILAKDLFSYDSSAYMMIPVGVGDGDSIVSLKFGEDGSSSHHGLIAGATGSGKSTLLHGMIMSGMLHYSPDELHLYLMDFKSGTEFKIYESVKLPHIQLLALDAMQEFGESILENLVEEMQRRSDLFKSVETKELKKYKEITKQPMPRILVIMDEFQILYNDSTNRKVANHCAELTKRLVTEGRAFGIHLFMATQSTKVITELTLAQGTIDQMRIRIGLKCGEDDARYLFSDKNESALSMMKGPIGTAVMNLDYTEMQNVGFRAAYCDDKTQREYLDLISRTYQDRESTLQIFEGSRTTKLLDYFHSQDIGKTDSLPVRIHMGSLIKVAPPFAITLDKKKKHNMLICGSNEGMANNVFNNYMISAIINSNTEVFCMDGDKFVGDDICADFYSVLLGSTTRFYIAEDRDGIVRLIRKVYDVYLERKKHQSSDVTIVMIRNLQFLDIVQSMLKGELIDESEFEDSSFGEAAADPMNPFAAVTDFFDDPAPKDMDIGAKFRKLVEDGAGFGISFVVSSLDFQTVRDCMQYGENLLPKFSERIIFSLGENEADYLIDGVSVNSLQNNTVYFTDGVKNTVQMKPYVEPDVAELSEFLNEFAL